MTLSLSDGVNGKLVVRRERRAGAEKHAGAKRGAEAARAPKSDQGSSGSRGQKSSGGKTTRRGVAVHAVPAADENGAEGGEKGRGVGGCSQRDGGRRQLGSGRLTLR
jgi:hypothetical protein